MDREDLYDGITDIRDDLICRAERPPARKRRYAAVAAVLAAALLVGAVLWPGGGSQGASAYAIAEAEYPQMASYPDESEYINKLTGAYDDEGLSEAFDAWWSDRKAQLDQSTDYTEDLGDFIAKITRQFLSGADTENRVCSPLNVYMSLAMLAELTDGNSRQQLLDLLGCEDIADLRTRADALWNVNYCDDGAVTSVLAGSLWLSDRVDFVRSTLDTLADTYHASSYQGEMGSEAFDQALGDWLDRQTGGILDGQTETLDPNTILALASTVYFRARWQNEFSESRTEQGVFHSASGDVTCDFMRQSGSGTYYWGEHFSAVFQSLDETGGMWLLLPDEGISVEELLEDDQMMELLLAYGDWEDSKNLIVNLSLPKFDVSSRLDLISGLRALGVTDVFDAELADFSPMTEDTETLCVSRISHAARVSIDEEGCTAASYVVMEASGASMPPDEEVDFVLDRPFLFAIAGMDGLPLFVGVVNQPVS